MSVYELGRSPRVVAGVGALDELGSLVRGLGVDRAVLIVDEAPAKSGYAMKVIAALDEMPVVRHQVPVGEPTYASVDAASDVVRSSPGAVVIGVGGGSALDSAKQAAVVAAGEASVSAYVLGAAALPGRRPIVAIPTTSGTGAEVTRTCIVSDTEGHKLWTWGDEMLPDIVILDPGATVTMPVHVTVATGLDAFVHALEASSGQRRNPMSAAPAGQALRLVGENLPIVVADGANLDARQRMQEAASLAGAAIDNCGTGIAHSIGHSLGSLHHVPHGIAVALGLDAAIDWNVAGAEPAYASAAGALGVTPSELPLVLRALFESVDFGSVVAGLPSHDMDAHELAESIIAIENQPMLSNNSRVPDDRERHRLAELTIESWKHWRAAAPVGAAR